MSDVLIFVLSSELKSLRSAFFALAIYILLQPFLDGNMLWFDLAIVPPVLAGIYLLILAKKRGNRVFLFLSGIFFITAFLIKQTTILFYLLAGVLLLLDPKNRSKLIYFLTPLPLLLLPLLLRLVQENALQDFLNWVVVYPALYWSKFPGYVRLMPSLGEIKILGLLFVALVLSFTKVLKNPKISYLVPFFVFALFIVYPRFSFFHLQLAIALLSIFIGYTLSLIKTKWIIGSVVIFLVLWQHYIASPVLKEGTDVRFYGAREKTLAAKIVNITEYNDRVYLLGLPSSIYAFADRVPPKRWVDNYGWYLEIPSVQEEVLSRWSQEPPKVILMASQDKGPWYEIGVYMPEKIKNWIIARYTEGEKLEGGISVWTKKEK